MGLTHAKIEVLDPKARTPGRLRASFDVQFNPTEYTLSKGAQFAEIGIYGTDSPILQFVRGHNERLTLDLFFDTTTTTEQGLGEGAENVTERIAPFYQLVKMQPETHAPPVIRFTWGTGLSFKAVVENVQRKFTLFNPEGIPLRATVSLTLREYKTLEEQLQELKPASADHSKRHVVQRGDTLSRIAAAEYGDPGAWRQIADANPELATPRQLRPGTELIIPALDAAGRPLADNRPGSR